MTLKATATQFENAGEDAKDIVIGFDFGTSCTKIVLQDPVLRRAFAVNFGEKGYQSNSYLLPTKLRFSKQGECRIAGLNKPGGGGLKLQLMRNPERTARINCSEPVRTSVSALASAYIALVVQQARLWFFKNFQNEYGMHRIRWHLNLGIPTPNYDDQKVNGAFLGAARAGWWLSIQESPITVKSANAAIENIKRGKLELGLHPDLINVVPEVAAEVASYARSYQREPGLHMIVDVGASTMDIATFRLESGEEEYEYWFLWAEVCGESCRRLHHCRIKYTSKHLGNWLAELQKIDETLAQIPRSHEDYVPPEADLDEVDRDFLDKAKRAISRVAAITYTKRDPNAQEWKSGVPLFLCGGGSNLSIFSEQLIKEVEENLSGYKMAKFKTRFLSKPDNLQADGLLKNEYHRLAVAFGLSFFYDDIGKTVPPSQMKDVERIEKIRVVDYIGKDMV